MNKSEHCFDRARKILVGGVNSPVRSFAGVGGHPLFIKKAQGAYLWDVDGKRYIDFVQSWGAMILGHSHSEVTRAATQALKLGASYGACHEREVILAELIRQAFPKTIERVRMMSSGTEAAMTALRIARGATGRDMIVKFAGGYHGHHDSLLASAGSGALTLGIPSCKGVPKAWTKTTIVAPYNDPDAVEKIFKRYGGQIAAVIVEPVACNMGLVLPQPGFLETLRRVTERHGGLLVFDEVITGFRLKWGGLSDKYNADLVCLGKIIGGGFPVGTVGGKKEFMELLAPCGPVYHAGTLSGNPIAVTAGIKTLEILKRDDPYGRMEAKTKKLAASIADAAKNQGIACQVHQIGSLLTVFFTDSRVDDYESAKKTDTKIFSKLFWGLIKSGVYWPSSNFEACFLGAAHSDNDLRLIIAAVNESLKTLQI